MLSWMESTAYSDWILTSYTGWPLMLSMHAMGLATIVGVAFALSLRMLGLYPQIPFAQFDKLIGIAWLGFAVNFTSGLSLFMTQAATYITSVPFIVKISFIILGCLNLGYTRSIMIREAANWEASSSPQPLAVGLAVTAMGFWTIAIVTGRLIAYL